MVRSGLSKRITRARLLGRVHNTLKKMIYKNFQTVGGRLVIHKDHLDTAVHEMMDEGREVLLDALWMGCDIKLSMEGSFIRISVVVYDLPESEEDMYDDKTYPLLDFVADIIKDMDASGNLTFTTLLVQPIQTAGGDYVEDVFCKDFGLVL